MRYKSKQAKARDRIERTVNKWVVIPYAILTGVGLVILVLTGVYEGLKAILS